MSVYIYFFKSFDGVHDTGEYKEEEAQNYFLFLSIIEETKQKKEKHVWERRRRSNNRNKLTNR